MFTLKQILLFIYLFSCFQGFILSSILLFARSTQRLSNALIASFILIFSFTLLDGAISLYPEFLEQYPNWLALVNPFNYLFPPILYFYTRSLTESNFQFHWKDIKHLLPFFMGMAFFVPVYQLPAYEKFQLFLFLLSAEPTELTLYQLSLTLEPILSAMLFLCYAYLSLSVLRVHQTNIKETYSSLEAINLNWLKFLIYACCIGFLIYAITFLVPIYLRLPYVEKTYYWAYLIISVMVITIGYYGLLQPSVWGRQFERHVVDSEKANKKEAPAAEKYSTSSFTDEQATMYKKPLQELMEQKKLFLDPQLTIKQLGAEIGLSFHQVSQVINSQFGENFYDFVNGYRISEAKSLLVAPNSQSQPVIDVGFAAGFNSKAAFYNAFKKKVGVTPSAFRKRHVK